MKAELLVKQIITKPSDFVEIDAENAETVSGLTKIPIMEKAGWPDVAYVSFAEAVEQGMTITETGRVPELAIHNQTKYDVFIPAGQLFLSQKGGWQDRMALCDVFVGKGFQGNIPVACVEKGRFHKRSDADADRYLRQLSVRRAAGSDFAGAHHLVSAAPMECSLMSASETMGVRSSGVQEDIWRAVDVETHAADAKTQTGTFAEVYTKKKEGTSSFKIYEGEIGAAFLGDGKVLGLEFYHSGPAWQKFAEPVIKRYDVAVKDRAAAQNQKVLDEFMGRLAGAEAKKIPYNFIGDLVSLVQEGITGSCLVKDATPLHLIALPASKGQKGSGLNFSDLGFRQRGQGTPFAAEEDIDEFIGSLRERSCTGFETGPELRYARRDCTGVR